MSIYDRWNSTSLFGYAKFIVVKPEVTFKALYMLHRIYNNPELRMSRTEKIDVAFIDRMRAREDI
ncbi:MAG: hypothetical protein ACRCX2_12390 [Paraclostridium sp.]